MTQMYLIVLCHTYLYLFHNAAKLQDSTKGDSPQLYHFALKNSNWT